MDISKELTEKALKCRSKEELALLAKENGIELTNESGEVRLVNDTEYELDETELENVSGGAEKCSRNAYERVLWKSERDVQFIFSRGDIVRAFVGAFIGNETATVRITDRKAEKTDTEWIDMYYAEKVSGVWINKWIYRSDIRK